jgi:excisionase family DNA binding protein
MNLADAIRQAAKNAAHTPKDPTYEPPQFDEQPAVVQMPPVVEVESTHSFEALDGDDAAELDFAVDAVTAQPIPLPESPKSSVRSGNVVRLELFLSPEQLSGLFRAVVATQHGMMTLREAAAYLRVNPSTVEQMAQEGQIPAISIEGRWRFPKNSLDEWLNLQVFKPKGETDAA